MNEAAPRQGNAGLYPLTFDELLLRLDHLLRYTHTRETMQIIRELRWRGRQMEQAMEQGEFRSTGPSASKPFDPQRLCQRCRNAKAVYQAHCIESEQQEVFVCGPCWDLRASWHEHPFWLRPMSGRTKKAENDPAWIELQDALQALGALRVSIGIAAQEAPSSWLDDAVEQLAAVERHIVAAKDKLP